MADATRVVIVHTLKQTLAVLEEASRLHLPVTLQSAPDAIFYAGSLYLLEMFKQARAAYPDANASFILDCGAAVAEAISAMQSGYTCLHSSAPEPLLSKLADIASQLGATIVTGPFQALDMNTIKNDKNACYQWLTYEHPTK